MMCRNEFLLRFCEVRAATWCHFCRVAVQQGPVPWGSPMSLSKEWLTAAHGHRTLTRAFSALSDGAKTWRVPRQTMFLDWGRGGGSHPLAASVGPLLHPLWPFCPALLLFSRLHAALMGTAWKTMLYHEFPSTCFLSGPSRSALCQARKWENSTNSQLPLHSQGRAI